jgi:DNA polymerase-3 subunit gamma/tau
VDETETENVVKEETLSTKEQYLRIIEQYPLVKELKDKLRMQLDY